MYHLKVDFKCPSVVVKEDGKYFNSSRSIKDICKMFKKDEKKFWINLFSHKSFSGVS